MMLIDSPLPELQVGLRLIVPVSLAIAGIVLFLVRLAVEAQRAPAGHRRRRDARRGRPGAVTVSSQAGSGRVQTHGEIWTATADVPIHAGDPVRVVAVNGLRLTVASGPAATEAAHRLSRSRLLCSQRWRYRRAALAAPDRRSSSSAFYLLSSIKILNEYERGVIFRLGKLLPQPKGPGVILVFAPIDRMVRVSLRTIVLDVPPQDVITRDNVSVKVNAVVYFRVMDPRRAIVEVENYHYATSQLAQTTLRSVLGQVELDDLLSQRERLNQRAAADPRPAHRSVGHQGVGRRSEARRSAARHAARDGPTGGSRAREACQDHPRRGRAGGVGEAAAGGRRHRHRAGDRSRCATCRR